MVYVKTLIFTVLVPGTVTVLIPYWILSGRGRPFSLEVWSWNLLGILPVAVGAACYFRCAWDFAFGGRGTPAPIDAPKTLVASGLYRVVRNPMYVGVALILLGESLVFESFTLLTYAFLVGLMFHLLVVYYEEPTLKKKFGARYEEYCQAAPRWLPRRKRAKSG